VRNLPWLVFIVQTTRQPLGQAQPRSACLEQHRAAVGTTVRLVKLRDPVLPNRSGNTTAKSGFRQDSSLLF